MHQDDFFYAGGGRQDAIDAIFEGIYHAGVVLLLVGAAGSGRSALIRRFCAEADPQVLAVAIVPGDILMSPDQLLGSLCKALGGDGSVNPHEALWHAVADRRAEDRHVVLVVDDAHELGSEARAEVVRFAREVDVALLLVGDESLAPAMDPEVAFEVIALRALSEEESEAFVAGWLAVDDEDELPSHRVIARLHRHSAGLPGRLAGLLGASGAERAPLLSNGIPPWHVMLGAAAMVALVVIVGFVVFMSPSGDSEAPVEVQISLPHPAAVAASGSNGTRTLAAVVPQPLDAKPYVAPEPARAEEAAAEVEPGEPVSPQSAPAATVAPVAPLVPAAVPGARLTAVPIPTKTAPALVRYSADEQALMGEARSRYTVQLFASFNAPAVEQFRARHAGTDIRIFRTIREDLPWYVAVTGTYKNRDEARAGITRLPLDLQSLKPWARSLQGIQDELRRRKD